MMLGIAGNEESVRPPAEHVGFDFDDLIFRVVGIIMKHIDWLAIEFERMLDPTGPTVPKH